MPHSPQDPDDELARRVRRSTAASGVPERLEDLSVMSRLARIFQNRRPETKRERRAQAAKEPTNEPPPPPNPGGGLDQGTADGDR